MEESTHFQLAVPIIEKKKTKLIDISETLINLLLLVEYIV